LQCIARELGKRVKDEQERSYLCCAEVHIADGEGLGGWVGSPAVLRCRGGAGSALSPAAPKGRFQDRQLRTAQYSGKIGLIESRDCRGRQIGCFTFFIFERVRQAPPPLRSQRRKQAFIPRPPPPPPTCIQRHVCLYPNHCTYIGKYSIKSLFCNYS
jgi:hypothetical protein